MDLSIMKWLNEPIMEEQLIPLLFLSDAEIEEFKRQIENFPSKDLVLKIAEKIEVDPAFLFFVHNPYPFYCYYQFPVFLSIDVFSETFIDVLHVKERIHGLQKAITEAMQMQDYKRILFYTEDRAKVLIFNKLYWLVPDEKKYGFYQDLYTFLDYGHQAIDKDIRKHVWKCQPHSEKEKIRLELDRIEPGEYITIFRGEGKESTPYDRAMSWTTSLSVAAFFATRIKSDISGKVYRARVRKEHVLDYIEYRGEKEILVFPEHLSDVEQISMPTLQEELEALDQEGYLKEYFLYKNTFLKKKYFQNPGGIHGIDHVKRVLYHAIALSRALGLSDSDRAILANASLYHDIGRTHDGYCTMHGEWSWRKYKTKIASKYPLISVNAVKKRRMGENEGYDLQGLNDEEQRIVQFIIEYHCREDEEGKRALQEMNLPHNLKERCLRLYEIFKDCDGLDRVRLSLKEFDERYLITAEAKKRLLIAYQVKNYSF